uniref:Uncharacterized protein n=1 Tax=Romanomermis culicivorax TaxID=13658 RepID=A0A915HXA9_ROMCU
MLAAQRIVNMALDVGDSLSAIRLAFFSGFKDNRSEDLLRFTSLEWSSIALKRVESICNDIAKHRSDYKMLSATDAFDWYEKTFRAAGNNFLRSNAEQVLLTDKLGYKYGTDLIIRGKEIPQFFFKGGLEDYVQQKICGKCSYNKPDHIAKCVYSFKAKKCQAEIDFEPTTESKKRSECKPYAETLPCELEQCCPAIHTVWSDWECVVEPCGTRRSTRTRYLSNTTIISFIQRLYEYNKTEHRFILDCPLEEYRDDPQCLKISYCSVDNYCSINTLYYTNLVVFITLGISILIGLIFILMAIKRHKDEQYSDRSAHGFADCKKIEASPPDTKQHRKSLFKQNVTFS